MNKEAFEQFLSHLNPDHETYADNIWQYFQREFPREAVIQLADKYGKYNNQTTAGKRLTTEDLVNDIERLWNGVEDGHICADGKYRKWPPLACSNCSHICSTCGGSGEVPYDARYHSALHYPKMPCPDCTEKMKDPYSYSKHWPTTDQRKGQQRKKGEHRRVSLYPGGEPHKEFTIPGWINSPLADRREGDRRDTGLKLSCP